MFILLEIALLVEIENKQVHISTSLSPSQALFIIKLTLSLGLACNPTCNKGNKSGAVSDPLYSPKKNSEQG